MAKWCGDAVTNITDKIKKTDENIYNAIFEKYGKSIKSEKAGINRNLMSLGFFKEWPKLPWKHPKEGIREIVSIIEKALSESGKQIQEKEIEGTIYPILREFFDYVFQQAKKCGREIPPSYKELHEELKEF